MSIDTQRRALLRGKVARQSAHSRPPWAIAEHLFIECCARCQQCLQSCPQHIIKSGDGGFPEIDFQIGECTFCGRCAEACPSQVFLNQPALPAWQVTLQIESYCLALQQVFCGLCQDQCPTQALSMQRLSAGRSQVLIDTERCNGCGACVSPCPVGAIQLLTYSNQPANAAGQSSHHPLPMEHHP